MPMGEGIPDQLASSLRDLQTTVNQLVGIANVPPGQGVNALAPNTVDPTLGTITSAGSRTYSVTTSLTAVMGTTTATFYWDGTNGSTQFVIYRDDGTKTGPLITGSPITVTGLTASTTYFFYPYWDDSINRIVFVSIAGVSVGTPAYAFTAKNPAALQQMILRGRIPISGAFATTGAATTGAGTNTVQGGNGGGSGANAQGYL